MALDLDAVLQELQAAKQALRDPMEGLDDLASVDLREPSKAVVQGLLSQYQELDRLISAAIVAIQALAQGGGFPAPVPPPVSQEIEADLQENVRTVTLGAGLFQGPPQATTFKVDFQPAIPKGAK